MTAMRAGCPGCGRVGVGAPCVLPFLHESLGGADARAAARLATLETPPVQNKALLSASRQHAQTD